MRIEIEEQKKANKAKKKQKISELKEIKLRPVTKIHDYSFKIKNAQRFLSKKDKVKFTVRFKGREMQHHHLGMELLKRVEDDLKEIKLRPVTDIHDYNFKLKNAQKFLDKGDKVKFTVRFKGREMQHTDLGKELMKRIISDTASLGKVEVDPKLEGRQIIMIVQPL